MGFKSETSSRSKFVWNMIGSMCNALSSFVLLTAVTRINGASDAGLFSLAFSTAQLLTTISCFETRAIQATDVKEEYKFKVYFTFRVCTCICMMLAAVGFIWFHHYTGADAMIIFFICLYKAIDGISDSYQGMFQQKGRIDLSGQALGMRVILSTIGFILVLFVTNNLVLASLSMVGISIVFIYCFDRSRSVHFDRAGLLWDGHSMKGLFRECFPLFIGSFMINYVVNASKYSIEAYSTKEMQAYYGFLLMPAFVINLFSLFAFRPMMTPMAVAWNDRDMKSFNRIIITSCAWASFLTVGGVLGAYLLGIPILNLVSGVDLGSYRTELCFVMFGGGLNALITIFYYVLAVLRQQKMIVVSYGVGFAGALIFTPILVKRMDITGAVIGYIVPMLLVDVVMFVVMLWCIRRKKVSEHE
ncbi:MAG: lipopolysaccharide biosynthesis protein [Dorea sp.]|nr:lipopolysaccharide biosynthesis protein [Dorea sp.]